MRAVKKNSGKYGESKTANIAKEKKSPTRNITLKPDKLNSPY